uniref:Uncharacterized protein n=1 Tax=Pipistrellus kuhlii TaxID=59472 RepID=A0A7J8A7V4_PIPKU|nr:hypothetical protein mPipKuh1_008939 [Pipistrellus kuhlii]
MQFFRTGVYQKIIHIAFNICLNFQVLKKLLCILDICQKLLKLQVCLKEHKISPGQFFLGVRALARRPKGPGFHSGHGHVVQSLALVRVYVSQDDVSLSFHLLPLFHFLKKYINGKKYPPVWIKKKKRT